MLKIRYISLTLKSYFNSQIREKIFIKEIRAFYCQLFYVLEIHQNRNGIYLHTHITQLHTHMYIHRLARARVHDMRTHTHIYLLCKQILSVCEIQFRKQNLLYQSFLTRKLLSRYFRQERNQFRIHLEMLSLKLNSRIKKHVTFHKWMQSRELKYKPRSCT